MENKVIQTQPYVAPLIEVFEIKVEQGFAASDTEPLGTRPGDLPW